MQARRHESAATSALAMIAAGARGDGPRVLVVGAFSYDHNEPSFCRGLRAVGAEVIEAHLGGPRRVLDILRRAQEKYVFGPDVLSLNAELRRASLRARPEVVLLWRTAWARRSTIDHLQRLGARVALYNNDDPFGPDRDTRLWRQYRRLIPAADVCFSYRSTNVEDYHRAHARSVFMLRSWYSPEVHRPIELSDAERARFDSDVTFVGHFEDDGRVEALERLRSAGLHLRIFGGGWQNQRGRALTNLGVVEPALGDDYARAIRAAKVALVFLSKRNRDEYTRRCFEIPAIGTMMLAPRTTELLGMFEEDREAAYFGSTDELVREARRYVADDALRARVARAGRARCLRDGHDASSRARSFLNDLEPVLPGGT
jgi:spore maturation protein CgeB